MLARLYLFMLVAWISSVQAQEKVERIVKTPQGSVRGYKEAGDDIYVFYGVPYATVPKGKQRFTAPYPPNAWLSTYDAVDKGIICPQLNMFPGKTVQEDCLIANIFVPDTDKKKLPVVVYVHGGAYQLGFSNLAVPKNLVRSKKIIAVTFNYRLGVHGFLCLGTENVPGNAGMKDQVALLKWVQRNIAAYGGDPDDVTIAGYSAGSSAVDLLMLSPSTKNLFNKVIPESGANIGVWSVQMDPLETAKKYAKVLGFNDVDNMEALENFYTSTSLDVLMIDTFLNRTDSTFVFTPCVERKTEPDAFLTESPYDILKRGKYRKLPILYGFANMEGLFRQPLFDLWKEKMNENFSEFLPADLKFESDEERERVAQQIKSFYFGSKPVSENILSYIDYFSDIIFNFPTLRAVKFHAAANHNKVYLYEYGFVDEATTPSIPHTNVKGANHCAQSVAIFDGLTFTGVEITDENNLSEEYKKMKKIMREIWINFITTGIPTSSDPSVPEWPATDAKGSPYMSLANKIELGGPYQEERMKLWHGIYDRYYRNPVPPSQPIRTEL